MSKENSTVRAKGEGPESGDVTWRELWSGDLRRWRGLPQPSPAWGRNQREGSKCCLVVVDSLRNDAQNHAYVCILWNSMVVLWYSGTSTPYNEAAFMTVPINAGCALSPLVSYASDEIWLGLYPESAN